SRNVMPGGAALQRVLRAVVFAFEGPGGPRKIIQMRADQGADCARRLGFSRETSSAILHLDERWDGRGFPAGLRGEEISLGGRIASLAQTIEIFFASGGPESARNVVGERRGTWFDPSLVDVFLTFARDSDFWNRFAAADPRTELSRCEFEDREARADEP